MLQETRELTAMLRIEKRSCLRILELPYVAGELRNLVVVMDLRICRETSWDRGSAASMRYYREFQCEQREEMTPLIDNGLLS
jgi:hypothetical protein